MPSFRYRVVDVFTECPLEGNPLAVFPDGSLLDPALMPRIAKELNLSETVFILPSARPECAARLRIFTPSDELIFAGHPTIGSACVLMDEGIVPRGQKEFAVEEGVGPVPVRVDDLIWLRTPPIEFGQRYDPAVCAAALGLERAEMLGPEPQLVTAGNPFIFVALRDRPAVDRAFLEREGMRRIRQWGPHVNGLFVFTPMPEGAYSRFFAPEHGIAEDPATGSATGPLAAYMLRHHLVARPWFVSEQGVKMGRRSLLHVRISREGSAEVIEVGGSVIPLVEATMRLP
ncbi:MAG TPA: PhzF family phenazine biosynthesis protein [Acidobacteriaceae bacterium]|nr:PhzF family phenazine biosynthesis protein [Acidobacteriaceae bacterium]